MLNQCCDQRTSYARCQIRLALWFAAYTSVLPSVCEVDGTFIIVCYWGTLLESVTAGFVCRNFRPRVPWIRDGSSTLLGRNILSLVIAGSPLRGRDGTVYVNDINDRACPLLFLKILYWCLLLSLWPFQLYFIP